MRSKWNAPNIPTEKENSPRRELLALFPLRLSSQVSGEAPALRSLADERVCVVGAVGRSRDSPSHGERDLLRIGLQESPHPSHAHKVRGGPSLPTQCPKPAGHATCTSACGVWESAVRWQGEEERRRPRPQPPHQVQVRPESSGVSGGFEAAQVVAQDIWDAVGHSHRERDCGRKRSWPWSWTTTTRLCLTASLSSSARAVRNSPVCSPTVKSPGSLALSRPVGQPGVLSWVSVHCHHLGDR